MQESNKYQDRYWKEMLQIKFRQNYVDNYFNESEKYDRYINIFLAITTNGSICSWIIWDHFAFAWGAIIAVSQLLNAIKSYLPYSTRKKYLFNLSKEISSLFLFAENKWYDVAEGKLTEKEIHNITIELRERFLKIDDQHSPEISLPEKLKISDKSKLDTETYFKNFYTN